MRKISNIKKKSTKIGRPPHSNEGSKAVAIEELFQPPLYRANWSELLERARSKNISPDTLSKYLKQWEELGKVGRDADLSTRPPRVYYTLIYDPIIPDSVETVKRRFYRDIETAEKIFYRDNIDKIVKQLEEEKDNKNRELTQVNALKHLLSYLIIKELEIWERYSTCKNEEEARDYLALAFKHILIPLKLQLARLVNPKYGQIRDEELKAYFAVGYRLGLLSRHDWENWNSEGLMERPE